MTGKKRTMHGGNWATRGAISCDKTDVRSVVKRNMKVDIVDRGTEVRWLVIQAVCNTEDRVEVEIEDVEEN